MICYHCLVFRSNSDDEGEVYVSVICSSVNMSLTCANTALRVAVPTLCSLDAVPRQDMQRVCAIYKKESSHKVTDALIGAEQHLVNFQEEIIIYL